MIFISSDAEDEEEEVLPAAAKTKEGGLAIILPNNLQARRPKRNIRQKRSNAPQV